MRVGQLHEWNNLLFNAAVFTVYLFNEMPDSNKHLIRRKKRVEHCRLNVCNAWWSSQFAYIWKCNCRYCNACEKNSFVLHESERTFACAKVEAKKILSSKARFLLESAETTVWEALNNALLDSDSDSVLQCNHRYSNLFRTIKKRTVIVKYEIKEKYM